MKPALAESAPPRRRVLLVDDEERFTSRMCKLLERHRFQVATAGDGKQALALIDEQAFDAVVLDIRMPVMDGMTVLRRVQENSSPPPVIMLTGHATLETGIEAIRQGAFDYLMKPCSIEDLVAKLEVACALGQIRRRPILWPRSTAGELILNAFRRIRDTDPLLEAFSIFNHRLPRMAGETLFIVDAHNRLSGHLSKQDIVSRAAQSWGRPMLTWQELSANPQWLPDATVASVMKKGTIAVEPGAPLKQVAAVMMENGIRTLPVTDKNRDMLGVVRLMDVLVYLDSAKNETGEPFAE
ncbi:MAG: response regulator [Desulfobacteraceae bacterium]|nr:response regulator [Desulfobacteraceae bacterium]MBC2749557.1 response regulator [Desulfobacteraceae bacterium]